MTGEYIKNKKGFGLLEIAISISLVMISIVPIVNMLSASLKEEANIRERLVAVYLAQEGMEIIRKIRDDDGVNWPPASAITGDNAIVIFDTGTNNLCKAADATKGFELKAKDPNNMQVLTKENNGFIQCQHGEVASGGNQWKKSGFQRYVNISDLGGGVMRVTVEMERNGQTLYSLTSYLNDLR